MTPPENRFRAAPAHHAPATPPARVVGGVAPPRECPSLRLYRDGLANLNGEATRQLKQGPRRLMLLPPAPSRPQWALVPAVDGLGLDITLVGWADSTRHLRFRAAAMAVALFAALPPEAASVRLALEAGTAGWQLIAR